MLWTDAISVLIESWNTFAEAHPELAESEAHPGAEAWVVADVGELGRLRAIMAIPFPLEPALGTITVMFRDTQGTTLNMPFVIAVAAEDLEEAQAILARRKITVAQATETSTTQTITVIT